jgi:hypothetical protein
MDDSRTSLLVGKKRKEGQKCFNQQMFEKRGFVTDLIFFNLGMTGPIPEVIGDLVNLELLSLGNNQLTGPIPEAIGNLVYVESLSLSDNQLTGPIPVAIGNLVYLNFLFLSDNQLTGSIPETIGNQANLHVLYLYGNELDPAPERLTTLCESRTPKMRCLF